MSLSERLVKRNVRAARAAVRVRVEATMTSTVRIRRGGDAVLSTSGVLSIDPDAPVVYEGPARLGNATGPVTYSLGEEVQFFSSGSATIPIMTRELDADGNTVLDSEVPVAVQINDLLEVMSGDDPVLVGRMFRVVDVENVGLIPGARRLQIVGVQRYPGWTDSAVRHPVTGALPDTVPPEWIVGGQ